MDAITNQTANTARVNLHTSPLYRKHSSITKNNQRITVNVSHNPISPFGPPPPACFGGYCRGKMMNVAEENFKSHNAPPAGRCRLLIMPWVGSPAVRRTLRKRLSRERGRREDSAHGTTKEATGTVTRLLFWWFNIGSTAVVMNVGTILFDEL